MTHLVSSELALKTLVFLSQLDHGLRVSQVVSALGCSYTGAAKALDILAKDGIVDVDKRTYSFSNTPKAERALEFSLAFLEIDEVISALARGNDGVEFAGADLGGIQIVFRRFVEPKTEVRIRDGVARLHEISPDVRVEFTTKEELRETLLEDLSPRIRAKSMSVLVGDIDRTFPDRTKHGDFDAKPLGRLDSRVQLPKSRRLRFFAREHGLRRIVAFGSATRDDFRPDSDLDLVVEAQEDQKIGLRNRINMIVEAERLFGRDVDIVMTPITRPALAERIERDGVVLYDSANRE